MKLDITTLVAQSKRWWWWWLFFFLSFSCTNSSGSLFSEELKTIIFGFKIVYFCQNFIMTHHFSTWSSFKGLCFF